jgi:hypothetical protein
MPSTSKKQHNFMAAVANNPGFAKKAGVPSSVGKEFINADKGRTFAKGVEMKKGYADGGMTMVNKGGKMVPDFAADGKGKMAKGGMAKSDKSQDKSMIKKAFKQHDMQEHKGGKGTTLKLAKGGYTRAADGVATKGKTKAKQITMKNGGMC